MIDYYDGPCEGLASFQDWPHLFKCGWDETRDDWSETFAVVAVGPTYFVAALEDWEIWLRYERAYHSGNASSAEHPALPADRERHVELVQTMDAEAPKISSRSL
ncbi:MAG: hypothetical protein NXI30_03705 [bacterium]|nr:hypothetical protein [bacterium]